MCFLNTCTTSCDIFVSWFYCPFQYFPTQAPTIHLKCTDYYNIFFKKDVLRFWFDRGVDGMRIDAIRHLYEAASFEDEPVNPDFIPTPGEKKVRNLTVQWRQHVSQRAHYNNYFRWRVYPCVQSRIPLDVRKYCCAYDLHASIARHRSTSAAIVARVETM